MSVFKGGESWFDWLRCKRNFTFQNSALVVNVPEWVLISQNCTSFPPWEMFAKYGSFYNWPRKKCHLYPKNEKQR